MSSAETPGCCTVRPFGGVGVRFGHTRYWYTGTPHFGQVLSTLDHPSVLQSNSALGGAPAPFACDFLRFGLSLSSCLVVSFRSSWEVLSCTETLVVAHVSLLARGCWPLLFLRGLANFLGRSSMTFTIVSSSATTKKKQILLKDKQGDWTSRRAIQAIQHILGGIFSTIALRFNPPHCTTASWLKRIMRSRIPECLPAALIWKCLLCPWPWARSRWVHGHALMVMGRPD